MQDRKNCEHKDFNAHVSVGRLSLIDNGPITHYCADITVNCSHCGQPFEFHGLPLGISAYRPTVSMDGLILTAPLMPQGQKVPEGIIGYSVSFGEIEQ